MKKAKFGIVAITALLMWSCSQSRNKESFEMAEMAVEETEFAEEKSISGNQNPSPETYISSSAALENPNDTTRKMIRTACGFDYIFQEVDT